MADFSKPDMATKHFWGKPPTVPTRWDIRPTPGRRMEKTETRGKWTVSFWFISSNTTATNNSSSTSSNAVLERHRTYVRQWHWRRCTFSRSDGVSLSRVRQSLDFSVENLTAWKRQSQSKTLQNCTSEWEKMTVQCGYHLTTIKNHVGSLKDRAAHHAPRNTNSNNSFKTMVFDRSDNDSKPIWLTAVPTRNTYVSSDWSSRKYGTCYRKNWSTRGTCRRGNRWSGGGMLTIYRKCWSKCCCW